MDATNDYVMAADVIMIALCLVLTVILLVIRIGGAALSFCHSAKRLFASTRPAPQTAVVRSAASPQRAAEEIPQAVGGEQPAGNEQSADSRQPAVSLQRPLTAQGLAVRNPDGRSATPPGPPGVPSPGAQGSAAAPRSAPSTGQRSAPSTPTANTTSTVQGSAVRNPDGRSATPPGVPSPGVPSPGAQGSAPKGAAAVASKLPGPAGARKRARPFAELYVRWHLANIEIADPVAWADIWVYASRLAATSGQRLPKPNNFFAALADVPGVTRLSDKRVPITTKTGCPIKKTTAYLIEKVSMPEGGAAIAALTGSRAA
ncbi:hypothetical protein [Hyphomicrobium sp.]|jgi:hypothetical protein|uniref:hypothetical protein n=1 Tax=Hyphomicrobium sp. TaxID=82 RepID=UPI00356B2496